MTETKIIRKVALFVCHDLIGLLILNRIIPAMKKIGIEPVIFNTTNKRNRNFKIPTPHIVAALNVHALEKVIFPFLETEPDTSQACLTYRQLAKKHSLDYQEISDVNAPDFIKHIKNDKEIIGAISARFLQVFDTSVIKTFKEKGFMWNLHSGLLGQYKGLLLPYRAIQNKEKEYGVTLHEITPKIDEGGIIKLGVLPLDPTKTVLDLYLDTVNIIADTIMTPLTQIRNNQTPKSEPQLRTLGETYYSNPTEEEFKEFMARGIFYADQIQTIQRVADFFAGTENPRNKNLNEALSKFLNAGDSQAIPTPDAIRENTSDAA